jgi:hypothetical protein
MHGTQPDHVIQHATTVAHRVREQQIHHPRSTQKYVTVSGGVAIHTARPEDSAEKFLHAVESACREPRNRGAIASSWRKKDFVTGCAALTPNYLFRRGLARRRHQRDHAERRVIEVIALRSVSPARLVHCHEHRAGRRTESLGRIRGLVVERQAQVQVVAALEVDHA